MADKGKKPFVTPVAAKNIAAAKAAWAGGAPTNPAPAANSVQLKKTEAPKGSPYGGDVKKENEPVPDPKAKSGAVTTGAKAGLAGKATPAAKEVLFLQIRIA